MEEKVYYENLGIKITNRRVITEDGTTIAISQINSVKTHTKEHITPPKPSELPKALIAALIGGVIMMIVSGVIIVGMIPGEQIVGEYGWPGGLISAILIWIFSPDDWKKLEFGVKTTPPTYTYQFQINTSSGESNAYESDTKKIIEKMVEALNEAIIQNLNTKEQAQQPQPKQESSGSGDKISKLKSLGEMLQAGLLTQEEFDKEKKKLLDD